MPILVLFLDGAKIIVIMAAAAPRQREFQGVASFCEVGTIGRQFHKQPGARGIWNRNESDPRV
ncbi:hypothetical protein [Cryobacterium sp. Y50]|uniref:hypothetical protein n=1 Tax=Cryobacterium sp. Y50 TaxID=2048286 RepID=UPI000CE345F7|nr:hypothetical protein [Cryobacterium sp. Y50]